MWEYETEEGAHDLYMDIGEEVRFRVVDESFVDTSPTGPSSAEAASSSEELPKKEAPYTLMVSCPGETRGWEDPAGGGAVPAVVSWVGPWEAQFLRGRAAVVLVAVSKSCHTVGDRKSNV